MPANRVFVTSAVLDRWVAKGDVEIAGDVLWIRATGARFRMEEAVHVVREVTGGGDDRGLLGRVRSAGELGGLGAEVLDRSMVLGDRAYDVAPGFLLSPLGPGGRLSTTSILSALSALSAPAETAASDEELLARYLIEKLE
jgi:hypothetical protein